MVEHIKVAAPYFDDEEFEAIKNVLESGQLIAGSKVVKFEEEFAKYIGKKYGIAVSNGTSALFIALEAMGIKEGDEVIVPPLTFFATISAVLRVGAKPVFADVDCDDLCISPESILNKISSRTKGIIPVHLYGCAAKMNSINEIARRFNLLVLEDCAQAIGAKYNGKNVGGFGTAGTFSFMATKHITTIEGGMIVTDSSQINKFSEIVRNHGMKDRDTHVKLGFNNRLNEIGAAIGLVQLKRLPWMLEKRKHYSMKIIKHISKLNWVHIPQQIDNVTHSYFWCPLMIKNGSRNDMEKLKKYLNINKIGFRHRYNFPLYRQPVLNEIGLDYSKEFLPNAEKIAGNIIGLPNHPGLKEEEVERVIEVVCKYK